MIPRHAAAIIACATLPLHAAGAQLVANTTPECLPLPPPLPVAKGVKDPVFALLIGLVELDRMGCLTFAELDAFVKGGSASSQLPYRFMREIIRLPSADGARVTASFNGRLNMRLPYRLLFYKPARLVSDPVLQLREWKLERLSVPFINDRYAVEHIALEDVHLFRVVRGRVGADIDVVIDRLLGSAVDDMSVTGVALFRLQGVWMGLAMGYNPAGRGRAGLFDFERDVIVYPLPSRMRTVSRHFRRRIDDLMRLEQSQGIMPARRKVMPESRWSFAHSPRRPER